MKTAVEWMFECDPSTHNGPLSPMAMIQAIQLDAKIQGYTEAAEIARQHPHRPSYPDDVNYRSGMIWMQDKIADAILAARDRLKDK